MAKIIHLLAFMSLLLSSCRVMDATRTFIPPSESYPKSASTSDNVAVPATSSPVPTVIASHPTVAPSQTPNASITPTVNISPSIRPIIQQQPGDLYETVFSLSVNGESVIRYQELPGTIFGPIAIAILPGDTFVIADYTTNDNRLLYYDQGGHLLKTIELDPLGIVYVADMRIRGRELFLLEITNEGRYRVHHLSLEGALIASDEIPKRFPSSSGNPLATGEVSISIDCDMNVLMEVEGGYRIYRFSDVLNNPNPSQIPNGFPCNGKLYRVIEAVRPFSRIKAGDLTYETRLTNGYGGLTFLDVFKDGSFYVVRNDVVNEQVIQVDQTVHYIGENGAVHGVARVPLSEFYYPIRRNVAINSKGQVFALLPRPDSLDVIRLNFYEELPPLIPGAANPEITASTNPLPHDSP
jgi:hypothetical protein